jgi:hypothetical protein
MLSSTVSRSGKEENPRAHNWYIEEAADTTNEDGRIKAA